MTSFLVLEVLVVTGLVFISQPLQWTELGKIFLITSLISIFPIQNCYILEVGNSLAQTSVLEATWLSSS